MNNKDGIFLEFDMPHIKQPLQLIILSIEINKYIKLLFFIKKFVFKVMEYPQTRTQEFNVNQEKKDSLPPPPLLGGGGGLLQPPSPLISGMTPLDENFYRSYVALTLIGG